MNTQNNKTHWLQNPNKNYLGHWDLPSGEDVILTIASAQWEEVKNPIINTSEAKRVIRFVEQYNWIKPFICNEINANSILKSTGEKFMEDCMGKKIKIGVGQTKVKKEEVDCLRVRLVSHQLLVASKINNEQIAELQELIVKAGFDIIKWRQSVKLNCLADLAVIKFESFKTRLNEIITQKNAANGNNI